MGRTPIIQVGIICFLNYIDDPELREIVAKQLSKGESGNRLARALAVGNAEYSQATKEDQERTEARKRLIKKCDRVLELYVSNQKSVERTQSQ